MFFADAEESHLTNARMKAIMIAPVNMTNLAPLLNLMLVVITLAGSSAANSSEAASPDVSPSAEMFVMFNDPACALAPNSNSTPMKNHAYFSCLNAYGRSLLADSSADQLNPLVADLQLSSQQRPSLSEFSIKIPLLDTDCITHPHTRGTGKLISSQMRSAALFLREFYKKMDGQTVGPLVVRNVEICRERSIGRALKIENDTLTIGLPDNRFYGHRELMRMWNNGDAYHDTDFLSRVSRNFDSVASATAKLEWAVLNPISPLRAGLRSALKEKGRKLVDDIGLRSARLSVTDKMLLELRHSSLVRRGLVEEGILNQLTEEDATSLMAAWKANLRSAQAADELVGALFALQSRKTRFSIKRDVWAIFSHSNWHHVGTRVSFNVSPSTSFLSPDVLNRLISQPGRSEEVNVQHEYRFRGLLSFDTFDHIQTDLDVFIETAGQNALQIQKDAMLLMALEAHGLVSIY